MCRIFNFSGIIRLLATIRKLTLRPRLHQFITLRRIILRHTRRQPMPRSTTLKHTPQLPMRRFTTPNRTTLSPTLPLRTQRLATMRLQSTTLLLLQFTTLKLQSTTPQKHRITLLFITRKPTLQRPPMHRFTMRLPSKAFTSF
jgi:hypothetical protein